MPCTASGILLEHRVLLEHREKNRTHISALQGRGARRTGPGHDDRGSMGVCGTQGGPRTEGDRVGGCRRGEMTIGQEEDNNGDGKTGINCFCGT